MTDNINAFTDSGVKTLPNSPVSKIDAIFVGDNSAAIYSAKEMLISAYVKSMINKHVLDGGVIKIVSLAVACAMFLQISADPRGYLKSGNAFFIKLIYDLPLLRFREFAAILLLHGNIVYRSRFYTEQG